MFKPKPHNILRVAGFVFSLFGWIGVLGSILLCAFLTIIAARASNGVSSGSVVAVLTAIGIGLSSFVGALFFLAVASIIDIVFEIRNRVYALPDTIPAPKTVFMSNTAPTPSPSDPPAPKPEPRETLPPPDLDRMSG